MNFLDLALPLIAHFEGCHQKKGDLIYPYLDTLAKPAVWTRGYGRTYGIGADSSGISIDEAKRELEAGVANYAAKCIVLAPGLAERPECLAAVSSWSWNCGVGAFKVSRLRRAINRQAWEEAAELIRKPRTAGGVELRGLARRRDAEAALFRKGI